MISALDVLGYERYSNLAGFAVGVGEAARVEPQHVVLQDENGKPVTAGDNGRRFFEAAWVHKYNGAYYFSYSTGDTHFIMYATGTSPYALAITGEREDAAEEQREHPVAAVIGCVWDARHLGAIDDAHVVGAAVGDNAQFLFAT